MADGAAAGEAEGWELRQKIGLVLGPVVFLATGFILKSHLTPEQSWAGATVLLMAIWWVTEALPLWVTSLAPLLIFPILCNPPPAPGKEAPLRLFAVALQYIDGNSTLFIGGMLIAACMQQWGLHRRIALTIVKAIGGSPRRIVLGFIIATGFISMWISNTASAMMLFPIGIAVIRKFEEQHGKNDPLLKSFGMALMLGIAYAASIGGIGTKIGTPTNLVFSKVYQQTFGEEISFLTWMKFGIPVVAICLPLVWFYLVRFAAKVPDEEFPGAKDAISNALKEQGPMSLGEWIAAIAFTLAATLWVTRSDLDFGSFTIPGWGRLITFSLKDFVDAKAVGPTIASWLALEKSPLSAWGDGVVAMVIALILLVLPVTFKPFKTALAPSSVLTAGWDMIILLGGGAALAYGLAKTGLSDEIAKLASMGSNLSPLLALAMVCLIALVLTEFASNTATANLLLPLMPAVAAALHMHPAPLMAGACMVASFGLMLPAGTPPNAICFASGYIPITKMVRAGALVDLFGLILCVLVAYLLVPAALGVTLLK
jgi:solute carrier family 13 (sodium-dependent dicarboxylate transporter), member 2/3/5